MFRLLSTVIMALMIAAPISVDAITARESDKVTFPTARLRAFALTANRWVEYSFTSYRPIDVLVYSGESQDAFTSYLTEDGDPSEDGFYIVSAGITNFAATPIASMSFRNATSGTLPQTTFASGGYIVIDNSNLATPASGAAIYVDYTITTEVTTADLAPIIVGVVVGVVVFLVACAAICLFWKRWSARRAARWGGASAEMEQPRFGNNAATSV